MYFEKYMRRREFAGRTERQVIAEGILDYLDYLDDRKLEKNFQEFLDNTDLETIESDNGSIKVYLNDFQYDEFTQNSDGTMCDFNLVSEIEIEELEDDSDARLYLDDLLNEEDDYDWEFADEDSWVTTYVADR